MLGINKTEEQAADMHAGFGGNLIKLGTYYYKVAM